MRSSRSAPTLAHLNWDKLDNRRNKRNYKLVNLCLQKKSHQFLHNYFVFNRKIVAKTTRQSRTEAATQSFYYNGCVGFTNFKRNCDGMKFYLFPNFNLW